MANQRANAEPAHAESPLATERWRAPTRHQIELCRQQEEVELEVKMEGNKEGCGL